MSFLFDLTKNLMLGQFLRRNEGARFSTSREVRNSLSARNKGLLLDGNDSRLSETQSFQNTCVIAGVGAGKTTRYVIPNLLDRASRNCSVVVNDPKGEIFDATAGYMQAKGFRIISIEPENVTGSHGFNPLSEAQDEKELEQIAEILIRASGNQSKDKDIWNQGAIRLVSVLLKFLKIASEKDAAYFTLGNLYYLLQHFGDKGAGLDEFILEHGASNPRLWNEWLGTISGNKEGVNSFLLTALTSLKAMSNPDLDLLTSHSSFKLSDIRKRKTVVYIKTPPQYIEYYGFFISIFFRSVFNMSMRQLPSFGTLPVYCLMDEFGHMTLPNFISTANTIRGYKVSLSIILQSISQLSDRYGTEYAKSIQGGFKTYITYTGSDASTRQFFEELSGKTVLWDKKKVEDIKAYRQEFNLMNAGELRTLPDHVAYVVTGNMHPIILATVPYFSNRKMLRKVKVGYIPEKVKNRTYATKRVPLQ